MATVGNSGIAPTNPQFSPKNQNVKQTKKVDRSAIQASGKSKADLDPQKRAALLKKEVQTAKQQKVLAKIKGEIGKEPAVANAKFELDTVTASQNPVARVQVPTYITDSQFADIAARSSLTDTEKNQIPKYYKKDDLLSTLHMMLAGQFKKTDDLLKTINMIRTKQEVEKAKEQQLEMLKN